MSSFSVIYGVSHYPTLLVFAKMVLTSGLLFGPRHFGCQQTCIGNHHLGIYGMVRFELGSFVQGQRKVIKCKSAYILLVIDLRGLRYETNQKLFMCLGWWGIGK